MRDMVDASADFGISAGTGEAHAQRAPWPGESERRSPTGGGAAPAVIWRLQGFDHGGNCYGFETTRTGDRSRIVINGKAALELPRAVWNALLEAAALQRRTWEGAAREELAKPAATARPIPPAAGALWDATEDGQLKVAFLSGSTIPELAVLHQRSRGAIASRLAKLSLIEAEGEGVQLESQVATAQVSAH